LSSFDAQLNRQLAITAERARLVQIQSGSAQDMLLAGHRNRRLEAFRVHHQAIGELVNRAVASPDGSVDARLRRAVAMDWNDPVWRSFPQPGADANVPRLCRLGDLRDHLEHPENDTVAFRVPAVVPFLGVGHLVLAAGAEQHAEAADALGSFLLRTVLTAPAASVRLHLVDQRPEDGGFASLAKLRKPIVPSRLTRPQPSGLRALLTSLVRSLTGADRDGKYDVLAITGFPQGFDTGDLDLLRTLLGKGSAKGIHVATVMDTSATRPAGIAMDHLSRGAAVVFHSPRRGFRLRGSSLRRAQLDLDTQPTDALPWLAARIEALNEAVGAIEPAAVPLDELRPPSIWSASPGTRLTAPIGTADGGGELRVEFGAQGAGHLHLVCPGERTETVALNTLLLSLGWRYSPSELQLRLLSFDAGTGLRSLGALPHARMVGHAAERELGLGVLQDLDREVSRRKERLEKGGAERGLASNGGRADVRLPRILTVLDGCPSFPGEGDPLAIQSQRLLRRLSASGPEVGIHLLLASRADAGRIPPLPRVQGRARWSTLRLAEGGASLPPGACQLMVDTEPSSTGTRNSKGQLAFLPQNEVVAAVSQLAKRARTTSASLPPRFDYDGERPVSPHHERTIQSWIQRPTGPSSTPDDSVRGFVGGPIDMARRHVMVEFPRKSDAHLLVVGGDSDEQGDTEAAFGVVGGVCASAALQLPRGKVGFWILDLAPRRHSRLPWQLLHRLHQPPIVERAEQLAHRLVQVDEEIDKRIANPRRADDRLFVVMYGAHTASFLRAAERVDSPDARRFKRVLLEGARNGVHLVLQVDNVAQLHKTLSPETIRLFGTGIVVRGAGGRQLFGNTRAETDIGRRFGYLERRSDDGEGRKFRVYGRALRRWLESLT